MPTAVILLLAASLTMLPAANVKVDLKVDHITIAGRDLKQLQSTFASIGIVSQYGGKHTNGLTEMAIASFADGSYLELIAARKPAGAAAHYWGKFIDADAGPCAWAISVPDISATGIGARPAKSGRARPDGVALAWESASIGPEPQGTFFPFMIHDLTPRARRAFPQGKPSAPDLAGVALVVTGVGDLDAAIDRYRETFHLPAPVRQEDQGLQAHLAWFTGTPVILAAPLNAGSSLAKRIEQFGEAPYAFVLDPAPHTSRGIMGSPSEWFGNRIIWVYSSGRDHEWIGIRTGKP